MERQRPGERDKQREMVRGKVGRGKKKNKTEERKKEMHCFCFFPFHCIQRKGKGSRSPCLKEERCSSIRALAA